MKAKKPRRWLAPWRDSRTKPAIYHCLNRIVDRQFVLDLAEKEKFRTLMRMYENFAGCRVLAYCLMSNHFHILLEVPPRPAGGLSDEELLRRLRALYSKGRVNEVAKALAACRERGDEVGEREASKIHAAYLTRMYDLSEFMKGVTQRFSRWFNRRHKRKGTLWEERFRSVIVESGTAARTMAAYIDLNPVRAGMVGDPADYRWSSYGEAVGGGPRGVGKKAREGLVRAMRSADGVGFEAKHWPEVSRNYRDLMGMALERKPGRFGKDARGERANARKSGSESGEKPAAKPGKAGKPGKPGKAGSKAGETGESAPCQEALAAEFSMARMLAHRVRYFSDGAVIGSRAFVDAVFRESRGRFGPKRKDGARKLRGAGAPAAGKLWSMRDLRSGIGE
jgi:REP element-mobilizing transposase RayT